MSTPKVVVFTHVKVSHGQLNDAHGIGTYFNDTQPFFESSLRCKSVGLIVAYVSYAIEEYFQNHSPSNNLTRGSSFQIPSEILDEESKIINIQRMARDRALQRLRTDPIFDASDAPRVIWVGIRELTHLFNTLLKINPTLVDHLASVKGHLFTYDSPKFVEAVLRIARSGTGNLVEPILRIDADVEINDEAVGEIQRALITCQDYVNPFYFFSGWYKGRADSMTVPPTICPVNSHAVRQPWLVSPATRKSWPNFSLLANADLFLRDLGEVGAAQVKTPPAPSSVCIHAISPRQHKDGVQTVLQPISGAGLVMSPAAIRALPPFMNVANMIIWIDDHLKRQLHEALGHIDPDDLARVETARFVQDRTGPVGVTSKSLDFSQELYFERLLRGCLMDALIKDRDKNQPGPLARVCKQVLEHELNDVHQINRSQKKEFIRAAWKRFDEVIGSSPGSGLWSTIDYGGDTLLSNWAKKQQSRKGKLCGSTVKDALSYVELLLLWGEFVNAILELRPWDAYWAFTPSE